MIEDRLKEGKVEAFLATETANYRASLLWLEESMPKTFFKEIGEENSLLVVHSLMGFDRQDYYAQINLRQAAIVLCQNVPGADYKIYASYQGHGITTMRSFVSEKALPQTEIVLRVVVLYFGQAEELEEGYDVRFARTLSSERKEVVSKLVDKAHKSDLVQCELLRPSNYTKESRYSLELVLACKGVPRTQFVPRFFHLLVLKKLIAVSVSLTYCDTDTLVIVCELHGAANIACWECTDIEAFMQELVLTRYFATEDLFEATYFYYEEGLVPYFLRSACTFVHQLLIHKDPHMFTLANVQEALCYWPEIGVHLFQLFCLRCDPSKHNQQLYTALKEKLLQLIDQQDTGKELSDHRRKTVLRQAVRFVDAILKTNFFVKNTGALAYRLDPNVLKDLSFPELPYGIFFIYNRDTFGFHVRFQDLARGGLRTVSIRRSDFALEEMPYIFTECYQLARTQQKKNKDIPEGGSKGILFLMPLGAEVSSDAEKRAHLYRSQRLFIESLLSLVNCDEEGALKEGQIVDYYKKPEYLYLGPDENMHDSMIEWIAEYAKKVGYPPGTAFITSKPKIGINHKHYGVTSFGVNCCMEEVLKFTGVDPYTQPFTVKMSGGPDGDVAGNQILNLFRYYPETASLITLIDISGVIYDPAGLSYGALQELFLESKPIRFYPPAKLSEGGFLLDMRSERREGAHVIKFLCYKMRNGAVVEEWISATEAHQIVRTFVHKTKTDVFIPAGGRPATLNEANVHDFLTPEGEPTSKIIIEGANLYLTPNTRKILEEKGVIVIKDSTANKGGVVCSSYEVLTSLSLTEEEFIAHKDEIVKEILRKIEEYCRLEVRLILETYKEKKLLCTAISEKISEKIDLYSDQIRNYLETVSLSLDPKDPLMSCFFEQCLPILVEQFSSRLLEKIPDSHKKAIISSWIASKLVYLRSLDWAPSIVDVLPLIIRDPSITSCPIRF